MRLGTSRLANTPSSMSTRCKLPFRVEFRSVGDLCLVLVKIKESAGAYLSTKVNDVVATVPFHFNCSRRQAPKDVGSISWLNVLPIIIEPTAVAIAYRLDTLEDEERNVFIHDMGGGTSDAFLLMVKDDVSEVKATAADTHLDV